MRRRKFWHIARAKISAQNSAKGYTEAARWLSQILYRGKTQAMAKVVLGKSAGCRHGKSLSVYVAHRFALRAWFSSARRTSSEHRESRSLKIIVLVPYYNILRQECATLVIVFTKNILVKKYIYTS